MERIISKVSSNSSIHTHAHAHAHLHTSFFSRLWKKVLDKGTDMSLKIHYKKARIGKVLNYFTEIDIIFICTYIFKKNKRAIWIKLNDAFFLQPISNQKSSSLKMNSITP